MLVIIFYIIFLFLPYHLLANQKAVVNIPIADLIGQQMIFINTNSEDRLYSNIPVCAGEITSAIACPRLHQLLYNDIVNVIKIVGNEACIQIPQAYCKTSSVSAPHNTYWTLKKNITLLEDIIKQDLDCAYIPVPIDFSDTTHTALAHIDIITLREPHHDSTMDRLFSAGTRFIKVSSPAQKRTSYVKVYAIDYEKMKLCIIKIPLQKCMININHKTATEKISDFITLLRKWSHQKNGSIAYVWGGTSFTKTMRNNFKEITKTGPSGDYSFYEYEKDIQSPKNGMDCSGMILRAAHICGIPYFCKNTTTIMQCLTPLKIEEKLQEGDLILIKGHVMVVSDMKKNLLIEARGYNHGYGKIHEISLSNVFDGIETYTDLVNVYREKKVIKRKDKEGKIRDTFSNLQLFSMVSCFK